MHLEGSSLETLREEEAGNPVRHGHAFLNPSTHEDNTLKEIIEPGGEGLQRGIGPGDPHVGYLAIKEIIHHFLQSLRHNDSAFNSFIEVDKGLAHDVEEKVESLKLLSQEHTQGKGLVVLIELEHIGMSSLFVDVLRHSSAVHLSHFTDDLLGSLGVTSGGKSRLNEENRAHEVSDLIVLINHVSVGVESEHFGIFIERKSVKVIVHCLESAFWRSIIRL